MSSADASKANPGLGWWPKLVLWSLVIVFGVLYLGSVRRHMGEGDEGMRGHTAAQTTLAPLGTVTTTPPARTPQRPSPVEPASARTESLPPSAPPVQTVEPAVSAPVVAGPGTQPADVSGHPADDTDAAKGSSAPGAVSSAEQGAPAEPGPGPDSASRGPGSEAPVGRSAAGAPGAVPAAPPTGGPLPDIAAPIAKPQVPAIAIEKGSAPGAVTRSAGADNTEALRRQIMAEYEAMQRAARERLPENWGPAPMLMPPGYPRGYPDYGYGLGTYPPR